MLEEEDIVTELEHVKAHGQTAYDGMRFLRKEMNDQKEEIKELLGKLRTLLVRYQSTCNSFHYAQSKAIECCRKERILRKMLELSKEL